MTQYCKLYHTFMQRAFGYCIMAFLCLFLLGCQESKIDISDGKERTSDLETRLENIDVASYEGLEDLISNSVRIESDSKPIMLIFGVNNCRYCDDLKQEMRTNPDTHARIQEHFKSYYINTSYSKKHDIAYLQKSMNTDEFARLYNVSKTPLVVWIEPNGESILRLEGYNKKLFTNALLFIQDEAYKQAKSESERTKLFVEQYASK